MPSYFSIHTLLLIILCSVLLQKPNVLAISIQHADTSYNEKNGMVENVHSTQPSKKAGTRTSAGIEGNHVLLDEVPILMTRTNEGAGGAGRINPKSQSKSDTSKSSPMSKVRGDDQQPFRRARDAHALYAGALVRPQPLKRPRLSRASDGEWKRSDTKPSMLRDNTELEDITGHKVEKNLDSAKQNPEQKAKPPVSLASPFQNSRHFSGSKGLEIPKDGMHLAPGAMLRKQPTHDLPPVWQPQTASAFGRQNDPHAAQVNRSPVIERLSLSQGVSQQRSISVHREGRVSSSDSPRSASRLPGTAVGSLRNSDSSVHSPLRSGAMRLPSSALGSAYLNQLSDARFRALSPRFPSSVPQADKLNEMLDDSRAQRLAYDPRQYGF